MPCWRIKCDFTQKLLSQDLQGIVNVQNDLVLDGILTAVPVWTNTVKWEEYLSGCLQAIRRAKLRSIAIGLFFYQVAINNFRI